MASNEQLLIPSKIKVGFQKRSDTYTGSLGYVIYYDNTGTLRKEKSWNSWRDKKIDPVEYENKPTEGFVLNKGVGGARQSWSRNVRNEAIRVYDPRNFEFEISVANLLFILRECDCSRGKGLEGKFVYAWDKTELVLLPVGSEEYKKSAQYTDLQGTGVAAKDLVEGATYVTKKQLGLTYLGRRVFCGNGVSDDEFNGSYNDSGKTEKKYIFWEFETKKFHTLKDVKSLSVPQTLDCHQDYASLVDKYEKSVHGSKIKRLFLQEVQEKDKTSVFYGESWYHELAPGVFSEYRTRWDTHIVDNNYVRTGKILYIESCYDVSLKDGSVTTTYSHGHSWYGDHCAYPPGSGKSGKLPWREPTDHRLFAEMESGSIIRIRD